MTGVAGTASGWLDPVLPGIPGLTGLDALRLRQFEEALTGLLAEHPVSSAEPRLRSRRLARIRRDLAGSGHLAAAVAAPLAGIAVTEAHGGSQVHATATTAAAAGDGTWRLTGTKTWISRLNEAAVFCVFFKDPAGG